MSVRLQIITYLILTALNLSCAQEESSKAETRSIESGNTSAFFSMTNTNSKLKYTSGIRAILHDSKGNYWFGSHQEGICLFDGSTFTYFTIVDGLSDNQVRTIQEDQNGIIWFGTANGVSSYNQGIIQNHTLVGTQTGYLHATEGDWELSETDFWFNAGNQQSGVFRLEGKALNYLPSPKVEKTLPVMQGITGFSRGKNGKLWIATYSTVFGYDGKLFDVINNDSLGFQKYYKNLHVRSILEDSKGNLWIGNNGIGVLLKSEGSFFNFSEKNGLIHTESSGGGARSPSGTLEHVFAITEDSQGNIWFGDRDTGAWKYDGKSIINYTVDSQLKTNMIWHIYEDRDGNLLFAMADGGIYIFNDGSFERRY